MGVYEIAVRFRNHPDRIQGAYEAKKTGDKTPENYHDHKLHVFVHIRWYSCPSGN